MKAVSRLGRSYGHIKDRPTHTGMTFCVARSAEPQPPSCSNRNFMPPIWNQTSLSACTGFSFAAQVEAERKRQGLPFLDASQLFPYFNGRLVENSTGQDCGAMICDVQSQAAKYGVCSQNTWPLDVSKVCIQPPVTAYDEGKQHLSLNFQRVPQDLYSMKAILLQGFTINLGIQVYESLESDEVMASGDVPMPNAITEGHLGGHAILIDSYDDATQRFGWRNSWGDQVGKGGYFTIPYDYILNPTLTSDLWTLELVQ